MFFWFLFVSHGCYGHFSGPPQFQHGLQQVCVHVFSSGWWLHSPVVPADSACLPPQLFAFKIDCRKMERPFWMLVKGIQEGNRLLELLILGTLSRSFNSNSQFPSFGCGFGPLRGSFRGMLRAQRGWLDSSGKGWILECACGSVS